MMKQKFVMLMAIALLTLGLSACNVRDDSNQPLTIQSITVDTSTLEEEISIDDFDLSSLTLIVVMSDATVRTVTIETSMVSEEDMQKLSTPGTHTLTITYGGRSTTLTIRLTDDVDEFRVLLQAIYEMGVAEGDIQDSYEEWLDSIRGEDGREIELRVADGHIQWRYVDDDWANLLSFETLLADVDVRSIESAEINDVGELILHYTNDTSENLGNIVRFHTVTFIDYNGYLIDVQFVLHGSDAVKPESPSREGHVFTGWYGDLEAIEENTIILAKYEPKTYMIVFDSQDGSPVSAIEDVPYGSTIDLPIPYLEGHDFLGWYRSVDATGEPFYQTTPVTGNTTLYARWAVAMYAVQFLDYEDNLVGVRYVRHGEPVTDAPIVEREGYIFKGWSESLDVITGDMTLQPVYQLIQDYLIEDAISRLQFSDADNVTTTFIELPTELRHGVQVSWESSDTDVIDVDGVVFRTRGEDKQVTLTATFTLDGVSMTREYDFTVRGTEDVDTMYTDFAQIYADNPSGLIGATGIVTSLFDGGFFFWDGEVHFAVFRAGRTVEIGDEVEVLGSLSGWQSLLQFSSPDEVNILTTGNPVDVPVEEISLQALNAIVPANDMTVHGRHYRITAEVFQSGSFVNLRDGDAVIGLYSGMLSESYDAIEAHIGDVITLDIIYYARTSGFSLIIFQGDSEGIVVVESLEERLVHEAKEDLKLFNLDSVFRKITLPSTGLHDATIVWTSSDETIIATDGTVTRPENDNTEVFLTAHITVGDVTLTKDFLATVLAIGEAPDADSVWSIRGDNWPGDGDEVFIEGIVSSYPQGEPGFFLQDEDGTAIYVRTNLDVEIGDRIVISATTARFTSFSNDRQQLINAELIVIVESGQDVFVIEDATASDIAQAFPGNEGFRYRLEDLEVYEVTQFNELMFVTNESMRLKLYLSDFPHLSDMEAGDTLDWIEFTVFELSFSHILMTSIAVPPLEGEELNDHVKDFFGENITLPAETRRDLDLLPELLVDSFNYADPFVYEITWTSSDESVIALDGTVTRPDFGDGNVDVTLTATITIDGTPETLEFVVTVLQMPDPEIGEAELVYETGFETATGKTSYAIGNMTANDVEWELKEALRGNLGDDKKVGDWAIRGRADGHAKILEEFEGLAIIEFMYAHYGSLTQGILSVEISADGGDTWVEVWVMPDGTHATLQHVEIELDYDTIDGIDQGDSIMVRWVFGGPEGNNSRMNLDEVKIYVHD